MNAAQLEAALALARARVPVFPCKPAGKRPYTEHGFHDATADVAQVRRWWREHPEALVGVPMGPATGLWALGDVNRQTGEPIGKHALAAVVAIEPPPYTQRSRSGGEHWFYRWHEGMPECTTGRIKGIDSRGGGGYVICWDMDVLLGAFHDKSVPEPPPELLAALSKPKPEVNRTAYTCRPGNAIAWAEKALAEELGAVASTAEGSRNHRLNVAAFRLGQIVGGGHLEPGRVEAALMVAAAACGLPADEAARTIASGLAAGLDEPRGPTTDNRRVQRGPRPNDASPGPDDPGPERGDPRPVIRANGADQHACDDAEPVDLWAFFAPPALPRGSLPPVIEDFAFVKGEIMGADPGGLAVAALAVCAGALTDAIKLQVKRHDPNWLESARLWVALIGEPSTKKSPVLDAAIRPLAVINAGLRREYDAAKAKWDKLSKEEKEQTDEPILRQTILGDTTIEAAQVALRQQSARAALPPGRARRVVRSDGQVRRPARSREGPRVLADGIQRRRIRGGPRQPRVKPDREPVGLRSRRDPARPDPHVGRRRP